MDLINLDDVNDQTILLEVYDETHGTNLAETPMKQQQEVTFQNSPLRNQFGDSPDDQALRRVTFSAYRHIKTPFRVKQKSVASPLKKTTAPIDKQQPKNEIQPLKKIRKTSSSSTRQTRSQSRNNSTDSNRSNKSNNSRRQQQQSRQATKPALSSSLMRATTASANRRAKVSNPIEQKPKPSIYKKPISKQQVRE